MRFLTRVRVLVCRPPPSRCVVAGLRAREASSLVSSYKSYLWTFYPHELLPFRRPQPPNTITGELGFYIRIRGGTGGQKHSVHSTTSFLGASAHPASAWALVTLLSDEDVRGVPKTVKQSQWRRARLLTGKLFFPKGRGSRLLPR